MIYSKHGAEKIKEKLVSRSQRYSRKLFINLFKLVLVAFVFIVVVCAGAGFGMMKGILDNSPDINKISIKPKGFKSTIYNSNGTVNTSLSMANSNRIYVYYDEIPKCLIDAFVSIEDERFWEHNGIDIRGILRVSVRMLSGKFDEGASTITQQLIKNHVFNTGMDETTFLQTVERKIQEQSLAVELEKKYSKKQILEYYLNTIYLGHGVNGVEAASQAYFDKKCSALTVSEAAVIAGITQNPYQFDPTEFPEENAKRRKLVLKKMKELGYIDEAEYQKCLDDPVYERIKAVKKVKDDNATYNSYYTDMIITELAKEFMEMYDMTEAEAYNELYTGGYSIYSVQDRNIQRICETVMSDPEYYPDSTSVGLEYLLTLRGDDGVTLYNYDTNDLLSYYKEETGDPTYNSIYSSKDTARAAADKFTEAMIDKTGASFDSESFVLSPQPQSTMTVIDQHTGYVKAIFGGRGEKSGNLTFDRATMGMRQPGSTFKVLASFMPYLEEGGNLAFTQKDEPYKYIDGGDVSNWYGGYRGDASIRDGIRDSMNIIAVKTLTLTTPEKCFEHVNKLGFTTLVDEELWSSGDVVSDINQSLALGGLTYGVTNLEITAAYASIANGGVYIKPVYYSKVIDHDGNVVIDNTNPKDRSERVMKATTAWMLIDCMKDVVTSGTGTPAELNSGAVCAGKTGTTSSTYDLWFCGMTAYYTASVWYGYDMNVRLGDQTYHKYMWRDVMDKICESENWDLDKDIMERPDGITTVTVCKLTGELPSEGCPTHSDYCAEDSIPTTRCKGHVTVKICEETHKIATDTCPNAKEYIVTTDPETGKKTIQEADFQYDDTIFDSVCDKHLSKEQLGLDESGNPIIKTSAGEGGTISGTVSAPMKATVTIYITPNSGYVIKDVLVDGKSVGPVNQYVFSNLDRGHTINASFAPDPQTTQAPPPTEMPTEAPTEAPTEPPTETPTEEPQLPEPQDGGEGGEGGE
ncbi:MAG: transglycosylase domain-containing protein [Eubacterium sp.]|nr:transglycosylase domain-containing protein [Eubacterium sp.]